MNVAILPLDNHGYEVVYELESGALARIQFKNADTENEALLAARDFLTRLGCPKEVFNSPSQSRK